MEASMTGQFIIPAGLKDPELRAGHSSVEWDTAQPETVEAARALYQRLTRGEVNGMRYRAARLTNGVDGEFLDRFDPAAGTIMFVMPTAGG
jgi:hypothetical protein